MQGNSFIYGIGQPDSRFKSLNFLWR